MTVTTVLVTGAFGQIGRRCTQILLDRGRTVIATDMRTNETVAVEKKLSAGEHAERLIPAYVDLLDASAVRELVLTHRPAAMIHLAAIQRRGVRVAQPVRAGALPYALLRLGGVASPDSHFDGDYLLLIRATPGDNRMHMVDARDAALAFANAVDREAAIAGKVLLIGGNDSYVKLERDLEDDMMAAVGLGRLGPSASLPGDPADDRGWSFTGWFDTTESQALLDFQRHDWHQTVAWVARSQGHLRIVLRALGPLLRPVLRTALKLQRAPRDAARMPTRGR